MKKLFKVSSKLHGSGNAVFSWQLTGFYLATAGSNGIVHIFDRQGDEYDEIALESRSTVTGLRWDAEGGSLAVLQEGNTSIPIYDLASRSVQYLDTTLKDSAAFLSWNYIGTILAIGTVKGNLVLYSKINRKILPIVGKHSRRITCGAWNGLNQLALGSEDKLMTISNEIGDTIEQRELRDPALRIKFGSRKHDKKVESIVMISTGKSLLLIYLQDPKNPVELTFQAYYGAIVDFESFGEGLLIIVFSKGYLIEISTKLEEIGEEVFSGRFFSERIFSACYSSVTNRTALSGDSGMKVIDMSNNTELTADIIKLVKSEENEASSMEYTADGQILTVATLGGIVQNFLAKMPNIFDSYNNYVAFMSSLREVSVIDLCNRPSTIQIAITIEPSFLALGPRHIAVGMNNQVWFYRCRKSSKDTLVNEQQYLGRVSSIKLSRDYACVLCDGAANLHRIEGMDQSNPRHQKLFSSAVNNPDRCDSKISCISLTRDFFIYSTCSGTGQINFFHFKEWVALPGSLYRHNENIDITLLAPNRYGTRIVFIDSRREGYLLHCPSKECIRISSMPNLTQKILWDVMDMNVFAAVQNDNQVFLFHYSDTTMHGLEVTQLGSLDIQSEGEFLITPKSTPLAMDLAVILVSDGIITFQQACGKLDSVTACTHDKLSKTSHAETEKSTFCQNLSLLRMEAAWQSAKQIDQRDYWLAFAGRAMHTLNISMARRAYRQIGDAAMVMHLDRLQYIDEKVLLAGYILLLFGAYTEAKSHFLCSSDPNSALEMHKHLLQWDQALQLADTFAIDMVPELSLSYASQLEFRGEFEGALKMYEHATNVMDQNGNLIVCSESMRKKAFAGVARCTFRSGNFRRGLCLLAETNDSNVFRECAYILESMKQLTEAAELYEKGKEYEKAVQIYLQQRNISKAAPLMSNIQTPRLLILYGRAKENVGDYKAAVSVYETANDMDSIVRIQLEHLQHPEIAFDIVRKTKSSDGALAAAKYCMDANQIETAIEFLLLANKEDEAFELSIARNELHLFTQLLGEKLSAERASKVANFYESNSQLALAADFYHICGNHHKAFRLYLQCGDAELKKAIEVVGKARNDMLTNTLIDHLMGESDGIPKDPNFIFQLYMALGNYVQAAKTAILIARQEQELGNYKVARDVLLQTHVQLKSGQVHISHELCHSLMLLHSYVLVKKLVKRNDHMTAARMLVRVAKHLSKFPTHASNILISTVIECQRAGLKDLAYDHATILMRAEYRNTIDKELRRKIEAVVRRPNKDTIEEAVRPCPNCDWNVLQSELDCGQCKSMIPYCVATGFHVVRDDYCVCPHCDFPALYSQLLLHLESDGTCPMCEMKLRTDDVRRFGEGEVKV